MAEARYLLDEHLSNAVARGLRRASIDASTVHEAGRRGRTDEDNLTWALANGRVLLTNDDDFLALAWAGARHAGVGFCHESKYSIGGFIRRIQELHAELSAEAWMNRVVFL